MKFSKLVVSALFLSFEASNAHELHRKLQDDCGGDTVVNLSDLCEIGNQTFTKDVKLIADFHCSESVTRIEEDDDVFMRLEDGAKLDCQGHALIGPDNDVGYAIVIGKGGGEVVNCILKDWFDGVVYEADSGEGDDKVTVKDSTFINMEDGGVWVKAGVDGAFVESMVENCIFVDVYYPYYINVEGKHEIKGSQMFNPEEEGIFFEGTNENITSSLKVTECLIAGNGVGINIEGDDAPLSLMVETTKILAVDTGISLDAPGDTTLKQTDVTYSGKDNIEILYDATDTYSLKMEEVTACEAGDAFDVYVDDPSVTLDPFESKKVTCDDVNNVPSSTCEFPCQTGILCAKN